MFSWPDRIPLCNDRVVVCFNAGSGGRYNGYYSHAARTKYLARPGGSFHLDGAPRLAELNRIAALRSAIAAGTATPNEVKQFESAQTEGEVRIRKSIAQLAEIIVSHREDPMVITGMWQYGWMLIEHYRQLGSKGSNFNPDTRLGWSGGTKGAVMPADYREQIVEWFAPARQFNVYGMSETSASAAMCEAGVYHWPPWQELLILDESGEILLPAEGQVTGRVASFDPLFSGRWGGIVTGDRATANFGRCACGRAGPTIEDSVTRYGADSKAGDDKLTCAAAVDAYVREAIS
jgi:hypothetical protein